MKHSPLRILTIVAFVFLSPGVAARSSAGASTCYDVFNRLTGVTDTQGSKSYTLDDQGGELTSATTYTGVPSQGIGYAYDPDGSRRTMTTPAGTTQYAYDGLGRLGTLTDPYGSVTGYGYYANGWPHAQSLPNAVSTYYSYDAQGELVGQQSGIDSGGYDLTLTNYTAFSYDGLGDRLGLTTALLNTPRYSGPVTYGYDAGGLGTLTSQTSSGGSGYGYFYNYAHHYDFAGNPTEFRSATGQTFNSDNQQTGVGNVYDGNGNPTTYGSASNVFDAFNRMTSTTASGNTYTLGYSADGLRAWNQYDGGAKNYFLYDGDQPVCEFNSSGTVSAVNTFGATGLVSRRIGSGVTYYVYDPDGNVAFRTGGSIGANGGTFTYVANPDLYDAYGSTYYSALASDPWGFGAQNGYYSDPEDGLIWCGHRLYDPGKGRWITRDPIGYAGGHDLYAYCEDGLIGATDPSGFCGKDSPWNDFLKGAGMMGPALSDGLHALHQDPVGGVIWAGLPDPKGIVIAVQHAGANSVTSTDWRSLATPVADVALMAWGASGTAKEGVTVVSRWGSEGLQPGNWVMNGPANDWNYFWPGKWSSLGGNQAVSPFTPGSNYSVPTGSVQWPTGGGVDGVIKGIFGQRIYRP